MTDEDSQADPESDAAGDETRPVGIVVSRADRASEHIGDHLLDRTDWDRLGDGHHRTPDGAFELRTYDDLHLDLEGVADDFDDPRFLVFVSRHSGDTGPLLSAHFTGNLGPAAYGGADHSLAPACPNAQRAVLHALDDHAPDRYDVSLECTHHGPSDPGAPAMFVELGSGDDEWDDPAGARAVAQAVLDLEERTARTERTVVAFGGDHYASRPTRIVRETDWACGHVAANWGLDDLDDLDHRDDHTRYTDVIEQVFTESGATRAIVDGDRPDLERILETLGYRVVSETWIRETVGVPLDRVAELEAALRPVADGLRFGDHAGNVDDYVLIELPGELLEAANAVDLDAITSAARTTSVAYETRENGNRLAGRAAFPSESEYDAFIEAICAVLAEAYESVELRADEVVVHEQAFDPERATEHGVPEGPKFGALAAGESVTVDGRAVHPADVTVERTRRYPR